MFNDPPYFSKKLDTLRVTQGEMMTYDFPGYDEKEGLPVSITLKYLDKKVLPDFMKRSNNGFSLDLAPTNLTKPGLYLL